MSFILDALRKSESERRRDAAPSLSQIPAAVPTPGPPLWIWPVIGVLCLCILVLAGAWWQSTRTREVATSAERTVSSLANGELPASQLAETSAPRASDRALPIVAGESASDAAARPEPLAGIAVDAARMLPSVADVRAAGIALPPLDLQLLSYSEDSTARFVFINGFQYRQGQRVQNGPLIVTIYPEGVVLRQEGRDFVLLPD